MMLGATCSGYARPEILCLAFVAALVSLTAPLPRPSLAAGSAIVATGLQFPEGAMFVGNVLYFFDYATSDVLRVVDGKVEHVWHQDGCAANGLVALRGDLLVACYGNGTIVRITTDGTTQETIRHDHAGHAFVGPNDFAADAVGGVYFTASGTTASPGKIFYRDVSGQVREMAGNIDYANGLIVSHDGKRLYVGESGKNSSPTFTIGPGGTLLTAASS